MNEQTPSLEQRVTRLENYVLSQGESLKKIAEGYKTIAPLLESFNQMARRHDELQPIFNFLTAAADQLGQGLLLLEERQQSILRYLSNFDAPAAPGTKEIFLDQVARAESATEKLQHFLDLIRQARKDQLQNPPGPSA